MLARTYPMKTSKISPDEPRKPTTLFDHFRADPRGAASYPEWLNRPAHKEYIGGSGVWEVGMWATNDRTTHRCMLLAIDAFARPENVRGFRGVRVALEDGSVVTEWLPETKESHNVEKT